MTDTKDLAARLREFSVYHGTSYVLKAPAEAADLIEQQAAEIAELRELNERFKQRELTTMDRTFDMEKEIERLRADAERWQWWRSNFGKIVVGTEWRGGPSEGRYVRDVFLNDTLGSTDPASLDAAIDAAMKGTT